MPHTNTWEINNLYRKFTGNISGDEILQSNFELQSHPNFKDIKYIINDFTEITSHSIEIVHTDVYAKTDEMIASSKGQLKIAIVYTIGSSVSELAESYRQQMIGNLFECECFHSVEEAKKWANQ